MTRRTESAKKMLRSQMGKKNKHLACSQFSFSTDVRQRSYSNDHEQKSLVYTVLHKSSRTYRSSCCHPQSLHLSNSLTFPEKQSLPKSCSLASVYCSAFPKFVLCDCVCQLFISIRSVLSCVFVFYTFIDKFVCDMLMI